MSGNQNCEAEERGGAGEGGSWSRAFYAAAAATAVSMFVLFGWQNRKAARIHEIELKLERNSVSIHRSQIIPFIELFSTFSSPPEERRKVLHSGYTTRGIQFLLSELDDLEDLLVERQHLFCSYFTPKYRREQVEKKIRESASVLIWYELIKKEDLNKVLREDRHCANCVSYLWTGDKRGNGKLMWKMLEGWRKEVKEKIKDNNFKNVFEEKEHFRSSFQR